MTHLELLQDFLTKEFITPPRPGLVFDRTKHRWIRPKVAESEQHEQLTGLKGFISTSATMFQRKPIEGYHYNSFDSFVHENGEGYKGDVQYTDNEKSIITQVMKSCGEPVMHACYRNATMFALLSKAMNVDAEIKYVEGYGLKKGLIPIQHAYVTINGKVYDPTWEKQDETVYFGVPFSVDEVSDMHMDKKRKTAGMIDVPELKFPYLKQKREYGKILKAADISEEKVKEIVATLEEPEKRKVNEPKEFDKREWLIEKELTTPPRPGLVFDRTKHRWVRPAYGEEAFGVDFEDEKKQMVEALDSLKSKKKLEFEPLEKTFTGKSIGIMKDNVDMYLGQYERFFDASTYNRARTVTYGLVNEGQVLSKKISPEGLQELVFKSTDMLMYQEMRAWETQLSDHGIRHISNDCETQKRIFRALQGAGVKITREDVFLADIAIVNHDIGYTVTPIRGHIPRAKLHPKVSKHWFDNDKESFSKYFTKDQLERMSHYIENHDQTDIDWEDHPVLSAISVSDNLSIFHEEKLPALFRYVEGATDSLAELQEALRDDDKEKFERIKKELEEKVDRAHLPEYTKSWLKRAANEVSDYTPKFTIPMLIGKLTGFNFTKEEGLEVNIKEDLFDTRMADFFDMGQTKYLKLADAYKTDIKNTDLIRFVKDKKQQMIVKIDRAGKKMMKALGSLSRIIGDKLPESSGMGLPKEAIQHFGRAELLILDCAMSIGTSILGHFNVEEATEIIKMTNPKNVVLTQLGRTFPSSQKETKEIIDEYWSSVKEDCDSEILPAYDGLMINTSSSKGFEILKTTMSPGKRFSPPKPRMRFTTEHFSPEELYEEWAKERLDEGRKLSVETKLNGFRTIATDDTIYFEDSKTDKTKMFPEIMDCLKGISRKFILDGEVCKYRKGKPVARVEMMDLLGKKREFGPDEVSVFTVFDLPFLDTDIHNETLEKRQELLKQFFDKYLKKNDHFRVVSKRIVSDKKELEDAVNHFCNEPGSEGALCKDLSSSYSLEGGTEDWSKIKTILECKVIILDKIKNKGGGYNYECGISL